MRFTKQQLREATDKATNRAKRNRKGGILLAFTLGCFVGLGGLHVIGLVQIALAE